MKKMKRRELMGWLAKNRWVWTPYAIFGVLLITFTNLMAIPYLLVTYQLREAACDYKAFLNDAFALMLHRVD